MKCATRKPFSSAITAAETGHLVFATLHTNNAAETIDRMIDVFPPGQQEQIRVQLANNIQAVISQQLLPRAAGSGRVPANEIMIATSAIRNLIRENKISPDSVHDSDERRIARHGRNGPMPARPLSKGLRNAGRMLFTSYQRGRTEEDDQHAADQAR